MRYEYSQISDVEYEISIAILNYLQAVNEEWLADKSRFSYDGLKTQRLAFPMVKDNSGELKAVEWEDTLSVAAKILNNANGQVSISYCLHTYGMSCAHIRFIVQIVGIAGPFVDAEGLIAFKDFLNRLGSEHVYAENAFPLAGAGTDIRSNYLLNDRIVGSNSILFIYLFLHFFVFLFLQIFQVSKKQT